MLMIGQSLKTKKITLFIITLNYRNYKLKKIHYRKYIKFVFINISSSKKLDIYL